MLLRSFAATVLIGLSASVLNAEIIALVNGQGFVYRFDTANLSAPAPLSAALITGLAPGDFIRDIDYRPQTGQVYGIGFTNQLYILNPVSGVASPVGSGFTPGLDGVRNSIDFNPTSDLLRVVGSNAANRQLDPGTGASFAINANLTYANVPGATPSPSSVAHSNSVPNAPLGSTREFIIDGARATLGEVGSQAGGNPSFDAGVVTEIGPLNLGGPIHQPSIGFDISGETGVAYVTLTRGIPNIPELGTIDLTTGAYQRLGRLDQISGTDVIGMTVVVPTPGTVALLTLAGLASLRRRR
jgi:hypothetical protein